MLLPIYYALLIESEVKKLQSELALVLKKKWFILQPLKVVSILACCSLLYHFAFGPIKDALKPQPASCYTFIYNLMQLSVRQYN